MDERMMISEYKRVVTRVLHPRPTRALPRDCLRHRGHQRSVPRHEENIRPSHGSQDRGSVGRHQPLHQSQVLGRPDDGFPTHAPRRGRGGGAIRGKVTEPMVHSPARRQLYRVSISRRRLLRSTLFFNGRLSRPPMSDGPCLNHVQCMHIPYIYLDQGSASFLESSEIIERVSE